MTVRLEQFLKILLLNAGVSQSIWLDLLDGRAASPRLQQAFTALFDSIQVTATADGKQVSYDAAAWQTFIDELEDYEDAQDIERLQQGVINGEEEVVPWEQAQTELRDQGVNV